MLAGLFLPGISATAAKSALFFGLAFYVSTTFILKVDMHFVHIWGIEFVLNLVVMFAVSRFYPNTKIAQKVVAQGEGLAPWKHAKVLSTILVITIILIYIWLGNMGTIE